MHHGRSKRAGIGSVRRVSAFCIGLLLTGVVVVLQPPPAASVASTSPTIPCSPGDVSSYSTTRDTAVGDACIAGVQLRTRGRLQDTARGDNSLPCLTGPISQNDNYPSANACGGQGLEALAQARLVNRANSDVNVRAALGINWTDTGSGVEPGIQWETSLPRTGERDLRPDFLIFNPTTPNAVVLIAEVKVRKNPTDSRFANVYRDQLRKYVRWWNDRSEAAGAELLDVTGYEDRFSVCGVDYEVGAEDLTLDESDHDPLLGDDANALLVVQRVEEGSSTSTVEQRLTPGEEPITCPQSVPEVGDGPYGDGDGETDPDAPVWGNDNYGGVRCAADLFQSQYEKLTNYVQTAPSPAGLARSIVQELSDQWDEPIADRCPPPGGGWGDPHLTSLDGLSFELQSVGEFQLLNAPAVGLDLQARFEPWGGSGQVSVISDLAFSLNGFSVEMDSQHGILVDGVAYSIADGAALYFNGGAFIGRRAADYYVFSPRAQSRGVIFSWGNHAVRVIAAPDLPTSGLLGNNRRQPGQ
ncbi:MAG: von Willebrand factor type protein [Nocardioides sp.]|nr:von Willebrand factor type protein [Nocardioides sp.]